MSLREMNPLDYPQEWKLYGAWMMMGQMREEELPSKMEEATKALIKQMHSSVDPMVDIGFIFKLNPTDKEGIYEATGAWKCYGIGKGDWKTDEREASAKDGSEEH